MKAALAILVPALMMASPHSARALEVQSGLSREITFHGVGCGGAQTQRLPVPTGARRVRIAPQPSPATDSVSGAPVARVTSRIVRLGGHQHAVEFRATGSDDVCAHPSSYSAGWRTRPVMVSFGYLVRRRVFFRSFNDLGASRTRYRPRFIWFGRRATIGRLTWAEWNGSRARGRGWLYVGGRQPVMVRVALQEAWSCRGQVRYLYMRVRGVGGLPSGIKRRYSERFGCF